MKIQITSLIILFTFQLSYSQVYRYADLSVQFTSPKESTNIQSPGVIRFQFKVVNNGPDSIFQSDTISYSPSHSYSKTTTGRKQAFGRTLAPNDSMLFSDSILIDAKAFNKIFYLAFDQVPMSYGPDNGKLYLQNEFSEDRDDNRAKVKLFHSGNLSATNNLVYSNISIYPNPVHNENVHISGFDGIKSIELLNEFGQKVTTHMIKTTENNYLLDTDTFTSGVYFARIKTSEGIVTKKLLIL